MLKTRFSCCIFVIIGANIEEKCHNFFGVSVGVVAFFSRQICASDGCSCCHQLIENSGNGASANELQMLSVFTTQSNTQPQQIAGNGTMNGRKMK